MTLSRWLLLIGIVAGLGCLKVAERNAVVLAAYAVGERTSRAHTQDTDVSWLRARVTELSSPAQLAQAAHDRQLKLVAWSMLPPIISIAELGEPLRSSPPSGSVQIAAAPPHAPTSPHE